MSKVPGIKPISCPISENKPIVGARKIQNALDLVILNFQIVNIKYVKEKIHNASGKLNFIHCGNEIACKISFVLRKLIKSVAPMLSNQRNIFKVSTR